MSTETLMKVKAIKVRNTEDIAAILRGWREHKRLDIKEFGTEKTPYIATQFESGKWEPKMSTVIKYISILGVKQLRILFSGNGRVISGTLEQIGLQMQEIRKKKKIGKTLIEGVLHPTITDIEAGKNFLYKNFIAYADVLKVKEITIDIDG